MREIRIPAFAKVNLCLEVLGKRADGYHELRTIFHTVSLHDTLRFRPRRAPGIELHIQGNEQLSQEAAEKNLVYRAVDALRRELKIRPGVEIVLQKKIPAGRGLGRRLERCRGGAAGLFAIHGQARSDQRGCWRLPQASAPMSRFSCWGDAHWASARATRFIRCRTFRSCTLLIVSPRDIHVPTPDAYRWLHAPELASLTKCAANHKLFKFCALCWSAQGERPFERFRSGGFPAAFPTCSNQSGIAPRRGVRSLAGW